MYGIPGHLPAIREPRLRDKWFSGAPVVHPLPDAIEDALDSALAATFPASDALSITQPGGGSSGPRRRFGHETAREDRPTLSKGDRNETD